MNEQSDSVVVEHGQEQLSLFKYIVGFVCSISLTLAAYLMVTRHSYNTGFLAAVLAVLAVVQFVVQMVYFLHVGSERKPRWKLMVAAMMLGVVLILVGGSLWVMNNLNYRMTPQQMEQYLRSQDSL